jgi:hypothetical protein
MGRLGPFGRDVVRLRPAGPKSTLAQLEEKTLFFFFFLFPFLFLYICLYILIFYAPKIV